MHAAVSKTTIHHELIQIIDREPMESEKPTQELIDLAQDGLSHDGILMTEALAAAHNAPDIREDRIAAIRARIAAGEYEIDLLNIAEGILRENPGLFCK